MTGNYRALYLVCFFFLVFPSTNFKVNAQIIPDNTLGSKKSRVTPINSQNDRIDGGAIRGSNLFHSFREFNISEGHSAYFANPEAINNIFSRVTGNNASLLLGKLGVLGNANLFLINPNGIIFGQNASLDIRGSFVSSTANNLIFSNGESFSATNPNSPPLLKLNTPSVSLQFAELEAKAIINEGNLGTGKNLALVGGTIVSTGQLSALNGEISLSTVSQGNVKLGKISIESGDIVVLGSSDLVSLQSQKATVSAANNLRLIDSSIGTTGDLNLLARGTVFIRDSIKNPFLAVSGKNLVIEGKQGINIFALNNSASELIAGEGLILRSSNAVIGDAHYWSGGSFQVEKLDGSLGDLVSPNDPIIRSQGDVSIDAYQGASLHILAGGQVNIGTVVITDADTKGEAIDPVSTPNLANITLSDGTQLTIDGKTQPTLDIRAGMNSESIGKPLGTIGEDSGTFFDAFGLPVAPPQNNSVATSADITIGEVGIAPPNGLVLLTNQYKPNRSLSGGDITITGVGVLEIGGIEAFGDGGNGSSVIVDARNGITLTGSKITTDSIVGNGGNITLLANENIVLQSGSFIAADGVLGGNITVKSQADILVNQGNIRTGSKTKQPELKGGDINIAARSLTLTNNGLIGTITENKGQGGNLTVTASESLEIGGFSLLSTQTMGKGNSGNLTIDTEQLIIREAAEVSSITFDKGKSGNLNVTASNSVELIGDLTNGFVSNLSTSSQSQGEGDVGDLTLNTKKLILRDGAQISATTSGKGEGGDLILNTDSLIVRDGAQISVTIFGKGKAGNLSVTASESVELIGSSPDGDPSGLFARTEKQGEGDAGNLSLETQWLFVRDGAEISADNFGKGKAGNVTLTVSELLEVVGTDANSKASRLSVRTEGEKDAGNLIIDTKKLVIRDGAQISVGTFGKGNGGILSVTASESVELIGIAPDGGPSGLFSASQPNEGEGGNAGDLTVNTQRLVVREGANISAGTFGNGNGGDLTVNASESVEVIGVDVNGSSSGLFVDTKGEGDAGNLILDTKQLLVQDGAQINASTLGEGKGGSLNITALESTTLVGRSPDDVFPSGLLAITEGEKDAGNLIITTKQFDIQDGAVVSAATFGSGQGGIISINAPQLITLGVDSKLTVETTGAGKPGDINISTDTLTIGEDAQLSATATATSTNTEGGGSITLNANNLSISGKLGIFAETKSIAPAGNLILQPLDGRGDLAPTLNIQFTDNGFISASTSADGQGGNITISAPQTLDIRGDGKITVETSGRGNAGTINLSSQILTLADGLEISASTTGEGGAGNINLTAKTIDLSNGAQIRTNTAGSNNAGDINLQIAENLKLTGENTGIFADTAIDSLGNGGNIAIDLSLLQIEDGATVSVNSQGKGIGGNISISSGDLNLNRGTILARSASNQGGNITLKIDNLFTLNNHSQISTTAGTEKAGGDGGNITINSNFIIANPLQNSDITANAFTGRGGNINITTQGILGLQVRKETTNLSDITASSEFGLDGTININDPGVDPTTGLENLPQTSIEATISQGCQVRKGKAAVEFYQLGKGGFPISPNDWLTADPFSYEGLIPLETLASSFQKIDRVSFVPNGFALSCQK